MDWQRWSTIRISYLEKNLLQNEYTEAQKEFLANIIAKTDYIHSLDNTNPEHIDIVQQLETNAFELFNIEQMKELFLVDSIVKKQQLMMGAPDELSTMTEVSKPACDCVQGWWAKCAGCMPANHSCTWRKQGCGFGGYFACNGKCPGK